MVKELKKDEVSVMEWVKEVKEIKKKETDQFRTIVSIVNEYENTLEELTEGKIIRMFTILIKYIQKEIADIIINYCITKMEIKMIRSIGNERYIKLYTEMIQIQFFMVEIIESGLPRYKMNTYMSYNDKYIIIYNKYNWITTWSEVICISDTLVLLVLYVINEIMSNNIKEGFIGVYENYKIKYPKLDRGEVSEIYNNYNKKEYRVFIIKEGYYSYCIVIKRTSDIVKNVQLAIKWTEKIERLVGLVKERTKITLVELDNIITY